MSWRYHLLGFRALGLRFGPKHIWRRINLQLMIESFQSFRSLWVLNLKLLERIITITILNLGDSSGLHYWIATDLQQKLDVHGPILSQYLLSKNRPHKIVLNQNKNQNLVIYIEVNYIFHLFCLLKLFLTNFRDLRFF